MNNIIQYTINITMESMMIGVLVFLLITCASQKIRFLTTKPLTIITVLSIGLMLTQIVTWGLFIRYPNAADKQDIARFVYALDFSLYNFIGVAFLFYTEALIEEMYRDKGMEYRENTAFRKVVVIWNATVSLVYSVFLFMPWFYHVENGIEVYHETAYRTFYPLVLFTAVCCTVNVFRNRKILKKQQIFLIETYLFFPLLLVFFDIIYKLSVSYVLTAFFAFILYVQIDLKRGYVIEQQEKSLVEMQTQIMLSQMQPHFLYNVLTTISGMCQMQNAKEARGVVNRFADYFRFNLDSLGKRKFIPFEKELEHIKTYLWLEKIRFEDALNVNYDIQTVGFNVPSLTIQPIVENAVKHGINKKEDGGTVTIRTYETPLDNVIIVEDDGVGFHVGETPDDNRPHVGIKNVTDRLKILCGGSCEIKTEIGKGTVVEIRIPKEQ